MQIENFYICNNVVPIEFYSKEKAHRFTKALDKSYTLSGHRGEKSLHYFKESEKLILSIQNDEA